VRLEKREKMEKKKCRQADVVRSTGAKIIAASIAEL